MVKKPTLSTARVSVAIALACFMAAPALTYAGVETSAKDKNPVEEVKKSCITGDLGVTFTNEYISRGIVQEKRGLQTQPYLDIYFHLYDGGSSAGFINSVTLNLSFWSSIHTKRTFALEDSTVPNWYEFDWMPGLAFTFAKNFTLTVSYFEFDSPNGGFTTARSINTNLAFNDTDLLGAFALHPHFTALAELDGKAGLGTRKGWYFEVGVAPSYTIAPKSTYPLTIAVPITAGFGDARFYDGDGFGYFSVGPQLSVPLAFIPSCFGSWTLTGSYLYYRLGDKVADVADRGNHDEHVFSGAIGLTF